MTAQNDIARLPSEASRKRVDGVTLLSVGGILAALGTATCCVVPFALFVAGVSGAWIGNLTALKPYQPLFVGIAIACLGFGFYTVYRKPKAAGCAEGAHCARPSASRNARMGLWFATFLIVVAVGFPYIARLFLDT